MHSIAECPAVSGLQLLADSDMCTCGAGVHDHDAVQSGADHYHLWYPAHSWR